VFLLFFFEKKNQKTFTHWASVSTPNYRVYGIDLREQTPGMKGASTSVKSDRWMWWPAAGMVATMALFVVFVGLPGRLNLLVFF
jgi:hypothetical protein